MHPSASTRTLLVTDLVGSTPLNLLLGDVRYVEVLSAHDHVVRARLRHHDGVELKHTGDGFCAWFPSAEDAVAAATGLQRDLDEWREIHPDIALHVRCGLAAGRPIEVGADLFGSSVALAARVCALADSEEVVLTAEVLALLEPATAATCTERGNVTLKGFPGPVTVYSRQVPT
jgi:class 3 adenylate cyclase